MDGKNEVNLNKYVGRRLSQMKMLMRTLETELEQAKGGRELTLDRALVEQAVDVLEIFIEDCDGATGGNRDRSKVEQQQQKPTVARLN